MCHLYLKVSGQCLTKIMRFAGPEEFLEVLAQFLEAGLLLMVEVETFLPVCF